MHKSSSHLPTDLQPGDMVRITTDLACVDGWSVNLGDTFRVVRRFAVKTQHGTEWRVMLESLKRSGWYLSQIKESYVERIA